MNETDYSFTDELGRKTLDAVATVMTDLEQGAMRPDQASIAVKAVFQAVSGLVGKDIFDLLSQASKEIQGGLEAVTTRRIFIDPAKRVVFQVEYEQGSAQSTFRVGRLPDSIGAEMTWQRESRSEFQDRANPFAAAHEHFQLTAKALKERGFVEIK